MLASLGFQQSEQAGVRAGIPGQGRRREVGRPDLQIPASFA